VLRTLIAKPQITAGVPYDSGTKMSGECARLGGTKDKRGKRGGKSPDEPVSRRDQKKALRLRG